MIENDRRAEKILSLMQKILAESRLLKQKHDELTEEYLKLKREYEELTRRTKYPPET